MESSGHVNAGAGSVLQADGIQRMDASIMNSNLECGCVSQIRNFLNPISIARSIMEKKYANLGKVQDKVPDHVYFDSERTTLIAESNNAMKFDINTYEKFNISELEEEFRFYKVMKKEDMPISKDFSEDDGSDTVGSVALDIFGNLSAGTSTGG